MPKASYESGSALGPGTVVTLRTDTANAQIYYSTDGTDPTLDTLDMLLKYTEEGIIVSRTVTVKAVAYREDLQLSKVGTFQYLVDTIPAVEAKKEAEAQAEEDRFRSYRDREYGRSPAVTPSAAPQPPPAARSSPTPAAADEPRPITTPNPSTAQPPEPAVRLPLPHPLPLRRRAVRRRGAGVQGGHLRPLGSLPSSGQGEVKTLHSPKR